MHLSYAQRTDLTDCIFTCFFKPLLPSAIQPIKMTEMYAHVHVSAVPRIYPAHTEMYGCFLGARWVMDTSCPGRESVCLCMMKFSTCPHSSNPLNILIITNLQTYSKGHTNTCASSFLKRHVTSTGLHTAEMHLRWPDDVAC